MCIYICTYIWTYAYIRIHIYIYAFIHIHIYLDEYYFDVAPVALTASVSRGNARLRRKSNWTSTYAVSWKLSIFNIFCLHVNISSILELTRLFLTDLVYSMPWSELPMIVRTTRIYRPILCYDKCEGIPQWYRHTPGIPLSSVCRRIFIYKCL